MKGSWLKRGAPVSVLLALFSAGCDKGEKTQPLKEEIKAESIKSVRSREDYEEAIRNFKDLLKREPDNIILLISLGNAYFDMGMDREAIKVYRKALDIYPDNVSVRTDLGTAYRRLGQPERALEEYRKSLGIDPRHSITRYNVGVVLLWEKKDIDGALKMWTDLLRIDPYFVLADELKSNIEVLRKMKSGGGGE